MSLVQKLWNVNVIGASKQEKVYSVWSKKIWNISHIVEHVSMIPKVNFRVLRGIRLGATNY